MRSYEANILSKIIPSSTVSLSDITNEANRNKQKRLRTAAAVAMEVIVRRRDQ